MGRKVEIQGVVHAVAETTKTTTFMFCETQAWTSDDNVGIAEKYKTDAPVSCQDCMRRLTVAKEFTCIGNGWV